MGKRAELKEKTYFERQREIAKRREYERRAKPVGIGRDAAGRVTTTSKGYESLIGQKIDPLLIKKITTQKISLAQVKRAAAYTVAAQRKRFGGMIIDTRKLIELTFPEGHPKAGQKVTILADMPLIRKLTEEAKVKKVVKPTTTPIKNRKKIMQIIKNIKGKADVETQKQLAQATELKRGIMAAGFIPLVIAAPSPTRDVEVAALLSDLDRISEGRTPKLHPELEPKEVSMATYLKLGYKMNKKQISGKSKLEQAKIILKEISKYPTSLIKGLVKTSSVQATAHATASAISKFKGKKKISGRDLFNLVASQAINIQPGNTVKLLNSSDKDIRNYRNALLIAGAGVVFGITIGAAAALAATLTKVGLVIATPFIANTIYKDWARKSYKQGLIAGTTQGLIELGIFGIGSGAGGKIIKTLPKTQASLLKQNRLAQRQLNKLPKQQRTALKQMYYKGYKRLLKYLKEPKEAKILRKRITIKDRILAVKQKLEKSTVLKEQKKLKLQISKLQKKLAITVYKKVIELRPKKLRKIALKKIKAKLKAKKMKAKKITKITTKIQKAIVKRKKAIKVITREKLTQEIIKLNRELREIVQKRPKRKYKFTDPFTKDTTYLTKKQYIYASREVAGIARRKGVRAGLIENLKQATKRWLRPLRAKRRIQRLMLERERIALRRQHKIEIKLRQGKSVKAIREGEGIMLKGRKSYPFKDAKTGEIKYFSSRKQWLKAVKQQFIKEKPKELIQVFKEYRDGLKKLKQYRRKVQRHSKKKVVYKIPEVKKIVDKKVPTVAKKAKQQTKTVMRDFRQAEVPHGRQQLVLLQKTKVKTKLASKQVLKTKQIVKQQILKTTTKTLKGKTLVAKLNVVMSTLAGYSLILAIASRQLSAKLAVQALASEQLVDVTSKLKQITAQALVAKQDVASKLETLTQTITKTILVTITGSVLATQLLTKFIPFTGGGFGIIGRGAGRPILYGWNPVKSRSFIYISDLAARIHGDIATKAEKKELLRVGRVFTGIERRRRIR